MKIKDFVKKHERLILATTFVGGAVIGGIFTLKITSSNKIKPLPVRLTMKELERSITGIQLEEVVNYLSNADKYSNFAIFKENNDLFDFVEL